jgi:hypothetical protein
MTRKRTNIFLEERVQYMCNKKGYMGKKGVDVEDAVYMYVNASCMFMCSNLPEKGELGGHNMRFDPCVLSYSTYYVN